MINKQSPIDSKKLISDLEFCVFDLETTGGNHQSDKIIEIGLVKIQNLKITKTKSFLINPEIKIPDSHIIRKTTDTAYHKVAWNLNVITNTPEKIEGRVIFLGPSLIEFSRDRPTGRSSMSARPTSIDASRPSHAVDGEASAPLFCRRTASRSSIGSRWPSSSSSSPSVETATPRWSLVARVSPSSMGVRSRSW